MGENSQVPKPSGQDVVPVQTSSSGQGGTPATASPPTTTDSKTVQRGAVKLKVSTSTSQLTAGKEFSVYVEISNPFSEPVSIESVTTILPRQFINIDAEELDRNRTTKLTEIRKTAAALIGKLTDTESKKKDRLLDQFYKDLFRALPMGNMVAAGISGMQVMKATGTGTGAPLAERIGSPADLQKITAMMRDLREKDANEIEQSYDSILEDTVKKLSDLEDDGLLRTELQPSSTTVQSFRIKTRKAMFFLPSAYDLHIEVVYKIGETAFRDTIPFKLTVSAPIGAMIVGATVGSTLAFLIRDIFEFGKLVAMITSFDVKDLLQWGILGIGNALIAVVLVIIFARKRDSQPILTVEDFWGGIFIGVLAGYGGPELLSNLVADTSAATPLVDGAAVSDAPAPPETTSTTPSSE